MNVAKTFRLSELYELEAINVRGKKYGKVDDVLIVLAPGRGRISSLKLKGVPKEVLAEVNSKGRGVDVGIPFSKVISFEDVVVFGTCP